LLKVTTPHRKKLQAALFKQLVLHVSQVMVGRVFVVSPPGTRFASPHHLSATYTAATGEAV
jgi:hypothetical protein